MRDVSIHIINELSDDILLNVAYGNDSPLETARELGAHHTMFRRTHLEPLYAARS